MGTGQFHPIQVIPAFQDSKQPPGPVLSMSTLSVLLQADTLYPHQSQNKPRAMEGELEGDTPLHRLAQTNRAILHIAKGCLCRRGPSQEPCTTFWGHSCFRKVWMSAHQEPAAPAASQEEKNTQTNLWLHSHAKGRALYCPRS